LIKKSFRAYNTGGHLVLGILPDSKMPWLFLRQGGKLQINLVLIILIVLPGIHAVEDVDQGGEILLIRRKFIMDVADQGDVQQCLRLHPEIVAALALTLGVGDQDGN